jgi:hypothetical protein
MVSCRDLGGLKNRYITVNVTVMNGMLILLLFRSSYFKIRSKLGGNRDFAALFLGQLRHNGMDHAREKKHPNRARLNTRTD